MRRYSVVVLGAALVVAAGCSRASSGAMAEPMAAPMAMAVEPAGRWSVALVAQGQQFDFVMELTKAAGGAYNGSISSQAFPTMAFSGAMLDGNRLKFSVVAPTGDNASFDIVFDGDTFSGDWAMPGDGSKVSGRRIQ